MNDDKQAPAGLRVEPAPTRVPDHFIALLAANAAASTVPHHSRRWAPLLAAAACTAVIGAAALIAGTQLDTPGVDPAHTPDAPAETGTPAPPSPSPEPSRPSAPTTDRRARDDGTVGKPEAPGSTPAATPTSEVSTSGPDDHDEENTGRDSGDASSTPDAEDDDEHSGPGSEREEPDSNRESDDVEDDE